MKVLRVILIIILVVLIAGLAGGIYGIVHTTGLDTTYPNLILNGVEVGGLTEAQVAEKLNASGWQERVATPLTVTTVGGQSFEVDPLQSGLVLPAEEAASRTESS